MATSARPGPPLPVPEGTWPDQLPQAQLELQAIFENAQIGLAVTRDRRIVRINASCAAMVGYRPEELLGQATEQLYPSAEAYAAIGREIAPLLSQGKPVHTECWFRHRDGRQLLARVAACAVDVDHPEWGTMWLFDDVTEDRLQARRLRDALLRVETLMRNAPVGIAFTFENRFTQVNPRFNEIFGFHGDEALGQNGTSVFPSEEAYAAFGSIATPLLSQALPVALELPMRRRDGRDIWVHLIGYVLDREDTSLGTIWLIEDRTESRAHRAAFDALTRENQAILDSAQQGIVVLTERRVQRCNQRFAALMGCTPNDLLDTPADLWFDAPEGARWLCLTAYPEVMAGRPSVGEFRLRRRDGATFWANVTGSPMQLPGSETPSTLWMVVDVSERRAAEEALRRLSALNAAVFNSAGVALIATDTEGLVKRFNATAEQMLGHSAAEIIDHHGPALWHLHAEVAQRAVELTRELGRAVEPGFEVFVCKARMEGSETHEWTWRRKGGELLPVQLTTTPVRDGSGRVTGYLGAAIDISDRRRADLLQQRARVELEEQVKLRTAELADTNRRLQQEIRERIGVERQMRQLAHFDPITDMPNRHLLMDRIRQALSMSARNSECLGVMFLDLDRFKNINDTLGHQVGDALLHAVARRVSSRLRASDTLARLGGDEFVILLPNAGGPCDVQLVAEKLIQALAEPLEIQGHRLHATTSIGISLFPQHGDSADLLLRNADSAMYRAKAAGRNTFRFFDAHMNEQAERRYRVEACLRGAIERGELSLHYQPLIDAQIDRVFGVEALVRWHSPELGVVPPGVFIEVAEESDLVIDIDRWVLRAACEQARCWREQGHDGLTVAVNLSARRFQREGLAEEVAQVLRETGHPAQLLELEITESTLMHDLAHVIRTLEDLVALGVRLVIDDFGTGYSSLAYLQRFPVHKLKIDQSFVRDIQDAESRPGIVKTVIALAQSLRLHVLAEGVETEAQLQALQAMGCQRFQGYLFARPQAAADVTPLLDRRALDLRAPG